MQASSPRTDLCDITDGDTVGSFDTSNGSYSFKSYDLIDYPQGQYTFEFTLVVGAVTRIDTFIMLLINPCNTEGAKITLVSSIADQNYTFFVNRESI